MENSKKGTKRIRGVGINDWPTTITKNGKPMKAYVSWTTMMNRCYAMKYQKLHPTYKGCKVDERWHSFSEFKKWYDQQNPQKGEELDKDILLYGNKTYGPDTCIFVPMEINRLFNDHGNQNAPYPPGIRRQYNGKFRVDIKIDGKIYYLGTYKDMETALDVYRLNKCTYVLQKTLFLDGTGYQKRNPERYQKFKKAIVKRLEEQYGFRYNNTIIATYGTYK